MGLCNSKEKSEIVRLADLMSYESRERALQIEVLNSKIKELEKLLTQKTNQKHVMRMKNKPNLNRFSYIPSDKSDFLSSTVNRSSAVYEINL